jgi:3-methyladenine DNA glycosylase AlkD
MAAKIPQSEVALAREILEAVAASTWMTDALREIRRSYSGHIAQWHPADVLNVANVIIGEGDDCARFVAYELVQFHKPAAQALSEVDIVRLGRGLHSWQSVDTFAYCISGPAWKRGNLTDATIASWAGSSDLWWRRAALASTVTLQRKPAAPRSVERALAICATLAADREDMVVKAMSWALREAGKVDADAVREFVRDHDAVLAARVKREVANKLRTGLKTPKRAAVQSSRS